MPNVSALPRLPKLPAMPCYAKLPAGARVLSSDCSDIALPGLSFRYRCSVRYDPAPPRPGTAPAPGGTP